MPTLDPFKMDIRNMSRMDSAESVFFARQLEAIDTKTYEQVFAALIARELIPTLSGIPSWAHAYTWREFTKYGAADFVGNYAQDLPRSDVSGVETSKIIKVIGAAYGYNWREIQAAAATGVPLDEMRARSARYAIDKKMDDILAVGDVANGLQGLLTLTGISTYTVATKAAGGLAWGTMAAPKATGDEVAADIMGLANSLVSATKQAFAKFAIVLPIDQYLYAAMKRLGSNSDVTALDFARKNCPFIESITPWYKCSGAGAGSTDRMLAYPKDPMVLGAIIPMEYTPMPAQQLNMEWKINAVAATGGVICRYPVAISAADGI